MERIQRGRCTALNRGASAGACTPSPTEAVMLAPLPSSPLTDALGKSIPLRSCHGDTVEMWRKVDLVVSSHRGQDSRQLAAIRINGTKRSITHSPPPPCFVC